MNIVAKELLFSSIGLLHEAWLEDKNKKVANLKKSVAKFMFPYYKELRTNSYRATLKLNSSGYNGSCSYLMLGLVSILEAIETTKIPTKLEKKWLSDILPIFNEQEKKDFESTMNACRIIGNFPKVEKDLDEI